MHAQPRLALSVGQAGAGPANLDRSGHGPDLPRHPRRLRFRMFEFLERAARAARRIGSRQLQLPCSAAWRFFSQSDNEMTGGGFFLSFLLPCFLPAFFPAIAGAAFSAASRARRSSFSRALLAATAAATASDSVMMVLPASTPGSVRNCASARRFIKLSNIMISLEQQARDDDAVRCEPQRNCYRASCDVSAHFLTRSRPRLVEIDHNWK